MASLLCRVQNLELAIQNLRAQIDEIGRCFYVTIWAADNGTITVGRWDYSWGNGNEHSGGNINDWGYVTHYPWELVSMSVGMRVTNTAATEVEMTVNGNSIGQSVTSLGSQTKAVNNGVSYAGLTADTINFRTVQNGGGNDVVVSALIKFTIPSGNQRVLVERSGPTLSDSIGDFGWLPSAPLEELQSKAIYVKTLAGMTAQEIDDLKIAGIGPSRAERIKQVAERIIEEEANG